MAITGAKSVAFDEAYTRKAVKTGPAGGLLIAVGSSLLMWAVIAQCARWAAAAFF